MAYKVKKLSENHKLKISLAHKGKKKPWAGKNSHFKKGMTAWNKGVSMTDETKKKQSIKHTGKKHSEETKRRQSEKMKRRVVSLETRKKMAIAKSGKNCPFWKGGISAENKRIRGSLEYRLWREAVYKRDNYTCIWCGARSGNGKNIVLNPDHIKPFSLYPELRFAIDNGRTLCHDCHKKTDTYGRGMLKKLKVNCIK